jgi:hypothetical protein
LSWLCGSLLVGILFRWLEVWLVGCLAGSLARRMIGFLISWLVVFGSMIGFWLAG